MEIDEAVLDAWRSSFLGVLPKVDAEVMLEHARERSFAAGQEVALQRGAVLIIDGLLRVYVRRPNGRQATFRYLRPGDTYGLAAFATREYGANLQTVTSARVLAFDAQEVRKRLLASNDLALSMITELSRRIVDMKYWMEESIFLGIRERVAHHLLDLASDVVDGRFVVAASQKEIADAVGSVREVIARTLSQFRSEGLITYSRNRIEILQPSQLHHIAMGEDN